MFSNTLLVEIYEQKSLEIWSGHTLAEKNSQENGKHTHSLEEMESEIRGEGITTEKVSKRRTTKRTMKAGTMSNKENPERQTAGGGGGTQVSVDDIFVGKNYNNVYFRDLMKGNDSSV